MWRLELPPLNHPVVQVYAAGGVPTHQAYAPTLRFPIVPGAAFYVVRVFGEWEGSQALVCAGRVHGNGPVVLREWDGIEVATLTAHDLPEMSAYLYTPPPRGMPFSTFAVDDHHRASVSVFALHATLLARDTPRHHAQALLRHLEGWARALAPDDVLPMMLAMTTLPLTYRVDRTLAGKSADQWSVLGSFPDPHRSVYDCDDGAHASLELFHLLCLHGVGPVADLARSYRGYLALGEICDPVKETYGPHCYVVLLSAVHAPITVESTACASGTWTPEALADEGGRKEQAFYDLRTKLARVDLNEDVARIRSPMTLVHQKRMYGALYAIVDEYGYYPQNNVDTSTWLTTNPPQPARGSSTVDASALAYMPRSVLPKLPSRPRFPAEAVDIVSLLPVGRAMEIIKGATVYINEQA